MTAPDVALIGPYPCLDHPAPMLSGVAGYTERLSTALAEQGMVVHVVAPQVDGERRHTRAGTVTVERCYRRGAAALPVAAAAAARTRAPVVHLQHETFLYGGPSSLPGLAPALARLRSGRRGPVVTMHQVVDPATVDRDFTRIHRVRVPHPIARHGLATVQRTVGRLSAATVVHEPPFEQVLPGSVVVPIGLDARHPAGGATDDRTHRRQALGLPDDRLVALCFGFLSPYKGLEAAIEAAALAGDAVHLVVAGGSHPRLDGRDPYADDLRRRYGDVARFVGYVPEAEVADWFGAADLLLLPYPRPFASSGPFAQALGYGTAVLCSPALGRCVGAPELLVAPVDPAGLAQRLGELASDHRRLEVLRSTTRDLAAGRTWADVARRHLTLYEEVIHAQSTARRRVRPRQPR